MKTETVDSCQVGERVLVVDDDQEMLGVLQLQLLKLGRQADLAGNGREAVSLLAAGQYGLVITDVEMPEMDGMALLRHVRTSHPRTDVMIVSGYSQGYSFSDFIDAGAADFIGKPFRADVFAAKVQRVFRERRLISDLARVKEKEKSFFLHIVESLAISLDEKDRYTHGHSRRVTNLALQLAEQVEEEVDFDLLRIGGILHDIGKIGVPDSILGSEGGLSAEEFAVIKRHPVQGAHILQPLEADERIVSISEIIMHHHEHYDGSGYPCGLKGQAIPLPARIVAIADSYDAMTSDRPYRKGLDIKTAIAEIRQGAGSQFDPVLVEKFVELMAECRQGVPCPRLPRCDTMFITSKEQITAYKKRYCAANFKACARYQIDNVGNMPVNFSPDGSLLHDRETLVECV